MILGPHVRSRFSNALLRGELALPPTRRCCSPNLRRLQMSPRLERGSPWEIRLRGSGRHGRCPLVLGNPGGGRTWRRGGRAGSPGRGAAPGTDSASRPPRNRPTGSVTSGSEPPGLWEKELLQAPRFVERCHGAPGHEYSTPDAGTERGGHRFVFSEPHSPLLRGGGLPRPGVPVPKLPLRCRVRYDRNSNEQRKTRLPEQRGSRPRLQNVVLPPRFRNILASDPKRAGQGQWLLTTHSRRMSRMLAGSG